MVRKPPNPRQVWHKSGRNRKSPRLPGTGPMLSVWRSIASAIFWPPLEPRKGARRRQNQGVSRGATDQQRSRRTGRSGTKRRGRERREKGEDGKAIGGRRTGRNRPGECLARSEYTVKTCRTGARRSRFWWGPLGRQLGEKGTVGNHRQYNQREPGAAVLAPVLTRPYPALASTIFQKSLAARLAPPTRAPFTFSMASTSAAFAGVTEPP